jgi:ribosome modulation factor
MNIFLAPWLRLHYNDSILSKELKMTRNEMNFWRDGYRARLFGHGINICPWRFGSKEARQWIAGWHRADEDLKESPK